MTARLEAAGTLTVRELLAEMAPPLRMRAQMSLMWLAKLGVIDWL
jgi:hypothetical protein